MSIAGVRWFLGVFLGCLMASLAVYAPALHGDYIWDDRDIYVLNNPLLPKPDGLYRFWFTTEPLELKEANAILEQEGFRGVMRLDEVRRLDAIPVLGTGKTDYKVLRAQIR